jgi:integrase
MDAAMPLSLFFERIYAPLKLRARSENTLRLYQHTLRSFEKFLERPPKLTDLNDDTVSAYLAWLVGRRLSVHTVNKERSQLLAVWNYAARKGFVPVFPDVLAERAPTRVPQAWTREELDRLFRACAAESGLIGGLPAGLWWVSLHQVLWDTGERIGAVLQLTWRSYQPPWILVPAESRKGRREDKLFKLGDDTQKGLSEMQCLSKRRIIFFWPKAINSIYYSYAKILKKADLPDDGRCKFHRVRRSVASYYEQAGGNATELLGHTSRKTTRAYLDPRIVRAKQPCEMLFRISSDGPPTTGRSIPGESDCDQEGDGAVTE